MPPPIESDEYETVKDLLGVLGPIKTGIELVRFIYEFGKTSKIEYAIADIRREIDRIKVALENLNERLDTVTQKIVKAENLARIRSVKDHVIELSSLGFRLENNPGDRIGAAAVAYEAGARADAFLTDDDLWLWSDVRRVILRNEFGEPTGQSRIEAVTPDFKTELALPIYSTALMVWLAAMMIETGSDRAAVQARYSEQLDRHLAAVSVRFGWRDDGAGAETLAEQIRSRITCQPIPLHNYARDGICTFGVQCDNTISRTRQTIRDFNVNVSDPGSSVLCTINPEVVALDERQLEDDDPTIGMLALWEEMLRSVASTGHLPAEPFIGVFPTWQAVFVGMYGVDRDLNLDYLTQILPSNDGGWGGPLRVGTSWNFDAIVPGGWKAVLAKQFDGNWLWYWHEGAGQSPTDRWSGPKSLGAWDGSDPGRTRWMHFGAGYGVVYGIVVSDESGDFTVGDLYWNRLDGYLNGQGPFSTPERIGNGWNSLSPVFSGSEGVVYGVRPSGVLRWYHHTGWETGANTWDEPRDLITNIDWRQFERIVPGGEGVIYGVLPSGAMQCYRHLDWRTGGDRLEGPHLVGNSWKSYRPLFAAQPGGIESGPH
jgi:hypothetical protein